jgi:hypothetical protein
MTDEARHYMEVGREYESHDAVNHGQGDRGHRHVGTLCAWTSGLAGADVLAPPAASTSGLAARKRRDARMGAPDISERGGIVRARALLGARLPALLDELTDTLVA